MWAIIWGACGPSANDTDTGTDSGLSHTTPTVGADPAPYCNEVSATLPSDPDVAGEGFAFSANDFAVAVLGDFAGTASFGGPAALTLTMTAPVEEVRYEFVDPSPGSDTAGPMVTAPTFTTVLSCDPQYRVTADLQVNAGASGELAEVVAVTITGLPGTVVSWAAGIALPAVVGTLRPTFDLTGWDVVELALYGTIDGSLHRVDLTWNASNVVEPIVSTATATTGTVMPSGMSETAGFLDLARAPDDPPTP